jgi:AraC family transcriptional regulator, melibiose operon regulatory protein
MKSFRQETETEDAIGLSAWDGHPNRMNVSHRHNDLELNLVERGSVVYFFGGRRYVFPQGSLVLFWAIAPHQLVECEEHTHMHWLTLPLSWFLHQHWPKPFRRAVLQCNPVFEYNAPLRDVDLFKQWQNDLTDQRYKHRFQRASAGKNNHEPRSTTQQHASNIDILRQQEISQIVLLEAEARLRRMAKAGGDPPLPAPLAHNLTQAEKIAAFLAEQYLEPVSVNDAAQAVGLHPNYAMNIFRKAYGQTMVEYLTQCRIAYAQQMLVTSDRNVLEIALQSGFGSVSQFYTAFKRLCGLSPRAYRQSLR